MAVVRCRVDMRMFGRAAQDWDRDKAFRILMNEFRHRLSDAGVMKDAKDHQVFESKSRKRRRKLRDMIHRCKQEAVEWKILNGEKVYGVSGRILKKIRSKDASKKKKNNRRNSRSS